MDWTSFPTANVCGGEKVAVAEPCGVVLSNTATVALVGLAATISALPSPVKSASDGLISQLDEAKVCPAAKEAVSEPCGVVFSSTDIGSLTEPTTRSGLPSPLMSPH